MTMAPAYLDSEVESLESRLRAFEQTGSQQDEADGIDWRHVVDTSNDAFLTCDLTGVLIEWNAKAEELFGWPREEAIGRTLDETILPPDKERGKPGGLRALAVDPKRGKRLEITARRRDGVEVPTEVSVAPMRHGSSFVFNAFVHDITARRELQSQLAHAQKLESIGQLSAGIAHEINTPTQYVGDNTRFLQEATGDLLGVVAAFEEVAAAIHAGADAGAALEKAESYCKEVDLEYLKEELGMAIEQSLEGIDRVSHIVRAMKEFSHPGASTKTPTDLAAAVQNTIIVATNEWKYVAEVQTDFDPKMPPVPCLPGDFNQVALNLIVNAAHAIGDRVGDTGEKGVITVRTRRDGDHAVLTITDTGCGIPEAVVGRIFDPFFTTKDVGVGTGQGLAIARNVVVEKHGGTIDVETAPGKGSTFTIRLPLSTSDAA